ncbi:hypothetical protein [Rhodanobacter soli]|uniref:hypothetical protein n=1 Tax=Rhodanobacter soli TaxID=590609 RepID=UPI0031D12DDA
MRTAILIVLLALAAPVSGRDFDYSSYKTVSLADAAAALAVDPRANYWLDAAHPRYHALATFTGKTRKLAPGVKGFIVMWVKAMQHPAEYVDFFKMEVQIRQGTTDYWMPIQDVLVKPFEDQVRPGDQVDLYLLLMGAYEHAPVFAISGFNTVGV